MSTGGEPIDTYKIQTAPLMTPEQSAILNSMLLMVPSMMDKIQIGQGYPGPSSSSYQPRQFNFMPQNPKNNTEPPLKGNQSVKKLLSTLTGGTSLVDTLKGGGGTDKITPPGGDSGGGGTSLLNTSSQAMNPAQAVLANPLALQARPQQPFAPQPSASGMGNATPTQTQALMRLLTAPYGPAMGQSLNYPRSM